MAFFRSIQICKAGWKNVSPWIFPHLFTLPVMMPVYGCFAMLLFCDAPFIDRHTPFLMIRQANFLGGWAALLHFLYRLVIHYNQLYSNSYLLFSPYRIYYWLGKVIRTLAMNPSSAYQKGIHLTVEINNDIVTTFSAIKATLISLGCFFGCIICRNCYF